MFETYLELFHEVLKSIFYMQTQIHSKHLPHIHRIIELSYSLHVISDGVRQKLFNVLMLFFIKESCQHRKQSSERPLEQDFHLHSELEITSKNISEQMARGEGRLL